MSAPRIRACATPWPAGAALLAIAGAAAAAPNPMGYLRTYGPAADPVTRLNWGLLTISVLVTVLIGVLLLWGALRRRPPLPNDANGLPPIGPSSSGLNWITIGVGLSTLVLLASAAWTLITLSAVAAPLNAALTVDVIAHQWWWELRYVGADPSRIIVGANEIHIPVGRPVRLRLDSADVIHSFWVPQLAGKTDLIPGQSNSAWLQADRAGDYRGQCGEYCGAQHAHMALHVVAEAPAAFDAWRARQLADSAPPQAPDAVRGLAVFASNCSMCHAVRGTDARGTLGPDLTHLMSRSSIAAGRLPNNTAGLSGWVADPQSLKPGTRMPRMNLSVPDLHTVVAYLETLK